MSTAGSGTTGASNWGAGAPGSTAGSVTDINVRHYASSGSPAGAAGTPLTGSTPGADGTGAAGVIAIQPLPITDVAGLNADQIMALLHGLQPAAVAAAGQAHTALGGTLAELADRMSANAQTLSQSWSGRAADAALSSLQQTHATTIGVAQAAAQTGAVLSWLGNEVLPAFKALPHPQAGLLNAAGSLITAGTHLIDDTAGPVTAIHANISNAAATVAQSYLTALNSYLEEANNNLPTRTGVTVSVDGRGAQLPIGTNASQSAARPATGGDGGHPVIPGSGVSDHSPSGASMPRSGASGRTTGVNPGGRSTGMPGTGSGASVLGSLQSVPSPTGTMPSPSGGITGLPTSGAGGAGAAPGGIPGPRIGPVPGIGSFPGASSIPEPDLPGVPSADFGSAPTEGDLPGMSGVGGRGTPGVMPGGGVAGFGGGASGVSASGAAATDSAYGAPMAGADADATGSGTAGFPMAGAGAGGQSDKERQRHAWMHEDTNIWASDVACVPPVIYGNVDWTQETQETRDEG